MTSLPLQSPGGTDNISADVPTPATGTRPTTASGSTVTGHTGGSSRMAVVRVILVQLTTAALLGYVIGFVGVYNTLNGINLDCKQYMTEEACNSPKFTVCAWQGPSAEDNTTGSCYFSDVNCYLLDEDSCQSRDDLCKFNYDDGECEHRVGFDSFYSGIFSGSMTLGAFIGSVVGGLVVGRIGRKGTLLTAALLNIVASALVHVARGVDQYWLLIAARVMLGLGTGSGCVAAPMYTEEMCPEPYRTTIGETFQVFCTFGIAIAAGIGLIVEPHDFAIEQNNEVRIQMLIMVQTFLCVLSAAVCALVPESATYLHKKAVAAGHKPVAVAPPQPGTAVNANPPPSGYGATADGAANMSPANSDDEPPIRVYPFSQMLVPLFTAFILCVGQQLTGINAIMNYAPSITTAMGLTALLGNFIIMVWNFISAVFSIPASKYFSLRQMFITGVLITTCAMLIAGIPTYPGVLEDETARHALAGLGIFLFILAYEVGVGPAFYVLSQALFPTSFRPVGSSFTLSVQYLFNVVINVFFPIATEKFSGGPSGNQDKGMAIVFFFFAGCGALSFVLLLKFLYPFDESKVAPDDGKGKKGGATEIA